MIDAHWRKATLSNNGGDCVEVRTEGVTVLVRDSKYLRSAANDPEREPIMALAASDWPDFLAVAAGNSTHATGLPIIDRTADGGAILRSNGTELRFTEGEWTAFISGVTDGEFDLPQAVAA